MLKGSLMKQSKSKQMHGRFNEINKLIIDLCKEKLNDEYKDMCLQLCITLFRKRPSPITTGDTNIWACEIIYAIGTVNFLFDSSEKLHIKSKELYEWFGIPGSTGNEKSKQFRDLLKTEVFERKWILPSKMKEIFKEQLSRWNCIVEVKT